MRVSSESITKEVQRTYDRIGVYFSATRQRVWPEMRIYLKNLKPGDKVLDLGCGNGRLIRGLNTEIHYTGVDFSTTLIKEARKQHKDRNFICGDISKEEVWRKLGIYDAIYCIAVFHHIPDEKMQIKILKNIEKHLNKGGVIYLSVWNLWQPRFLKDHLMSLKEKIQNWRWLRVPFQNTEKRFCFAHDRWSLERLIDKTDFKIKEVRYWTKEGNSGNVFTGANMWVILERP